MAHVCRWWYTYFFDNPLRRLVHDADQLLRPYVRAGMRTADIGCGMGYFTVAMADLAGPSGNVLAIDLQPQQLRCVHKRLHRAGLSQRVELITTTADSLRLRGPLHFILAFWMVHEVPDHDRLFAEIREHLADDGLLLITEPKFHVRKAQFDAMVLAAARQGLDHAPPVEPVRLSLAAVFRRKPAGGAR